MAAMGLASTLALAAPGVAGAATLVTGSFNTAVCGGTGQNACTSLAGVTTPLTFTSTSGDTTLKMMATAWQVKQSDNSVVAANIGLYSGGGIGVTGTVNNNDSGGSNNLHTIDNLGGYTDFILLQFNRAVQLSSATLNVYLPTGQTTRDSDLSWYNNAGNAIPVPTVWNSSINLTSGANSNNPAAWTNVCGNSTTPETLALNISTPAGCGTSGATSTTLTSAQMGFSQIWLISAAQLATTDRNDAFKLSTLNVSAYAPTPEPATWAMMIMGFGAIGATLRRRRATGALATA